MQSRKSFWKGTTEMSQLALAPESTAAETGIRRVRMLAAVALVSFASLLLELSLTRLFSVVLFYHFAFLSVSIALLGLGAGGVFAYIRKCWIERWSIARLGSGLCLLAAVAAVLALLIVWNLTGTICDVVYAKGARLDRSKRLFARWNAISRIEVNQLGQSLYIVIDADANSAIMGVDPHAWHGTVWQHNLMAAAPAIANVLRPKGSYAIIGPGGGVDVLRAVANGSQRAVGIEINPIIVNGVMRGRFADYAHHLYDIPEIEMHVSDGRSWIRSSHERFDVVQMTLVDTWASTAAGAFALSENNLYTREAFREYFQHLKPDGFLAITRWEFRRPREALRVVSEAMDVLMSLGVPQQELANHFVVVADGKLDEDGISVTTIAKRSPLTAEEQAAVAEHLRDNPALALLYSPANAPQNPFTELIRSKEPQAFAANYSYNVAPVTDDAPFFFFTLKTKDVLRQLA